jgi:hypothetical protein
MTCKGLFFRAETYVDNLYRTRQDSYILTLLFWTRIVLTLKRALVLSLKNVYFTRISYLIYRYG